MQVFQECFKRYQEGERAPNQTQVWLQDFIQTSWQATDAEIYEMKKLLQSTPESTPMYDAFTLEDVETEVPEEEQGTRQ